MSDAPRYDGTIDRLEPHKGYGFLIGTSPDLLGERVFFHESACDHWATDLKVGQRVTFAIVRAGHGRVGWRAVAIRLVDEGRR